MECRIESCSRPVFVKKEQLCQRHYTRLIRHGDAEASIKPERGTCSVEGCDRPHSARGLCQTHYRRARRSSAVKSCQPCLVCGGEIPSGRSSLTIYCSPSCRAASKNARQNNRPVRQRVGVCEECGNSLPADSHRNVILCSERCRKARASRVNRESRLWQLYNLTVEDYDRILAAQGGVCAGCGRTKNLCVDHEKESGLVRGILCRDCNTGIGALRHDTTILGQLTVYLKEPPAQR